MSWLGLRDKATCDHAWERHLWEWDAGTTYCPLCGTTDRSANRPSAERIQCALLALSRVMVWVWMEARVQALPGTGLFPARAEVFADAFFRGLLTLSYRSDP